MALFGKKKEQPAALCCDGCAGCTPQNMEKAEAAKSEGPSVKILGSGCAKCNALEAATKTALERLGMDTLIDHVTDFAKIAAYGVMTTPALVVDGKVVSYGKVLKPDEVAKILAKIRG
ncbi:MAG: thioredoxin family protein [Eubacteriales bacterium]|nr:thioredoxin family protein [Eubacteriales bacterium]